MRARRIIESTLPLFDERSRPCGAESKSRNPKSRIDHTAIRASAGSGKTFQLTNRYLQLINAGIEPHTILATTFTRLAAGQIRDRILARLAGAADDARKRADLALHLHHPNLSPEAVIALLTTLARNLHRMQIRTLDSFFASVVRSFAIELGLPTGADVIDENEARQLRGEAIRLMLDERKPQQLIELLRLLTQGSSQRGVMRTIDEVVTGLYSLFREAPPASWECVEEPGGLLMPAELVIAIKALENLVCDNGHHANAHAEACQRARQHDWEGFISAGIAKAMIEGKNSFHSKAIEPGTRALYEPLVQHARAELLGRARRQTIATRDLLQRFHEQLERLKRKRQAITFDDLSSAMLQAEQRGTLDDIGFRLDARLHHLLLDEFQDTSIPQWRALQPIALELVSRMPPERSFFCVGDVKQSIYGWRQGAPEVLDELPNLLAGAITELDLAVSYRSSPVIIDVVNRLFTSIERNEALRDDEDGAEAWKHGFAKHTTKKEDLPGYAELRIMRRANEDEDSTRIRLAQAADLVAELHRRNPALKIAVLTRTNDAVARLLFEFSPGQRNVPASGRGGGPLTDAPAVNVMLDLLQLGDHPDDTVAAFNIACSPLGAIVNLRDWRDERARRSLSQRLRCRLLHEGYATVLSECVMQIAPTCDQRELRRLHQLVELAGVHESRATLRTGDFIDMVENSAVADAVPSPVEVMTIHQAKGLEFDAVVLPELETDLRGEQAPPVVFERDGEAGQITRICRYMNGTVRALTPELQPLFDRHRRRTVRESLSLLYVAMTRAIHGLYMIIDPPAENEQSIPKKLAGVLRCGLGGKIMPGELAYSHGSSDWVESLCGGAGGAKPQALAETIAAPIRLARSKANFVCARGAAAKSASSLHESVGGRFNRFRVPGADAKDRGLALHAMLCEVEWLEDFRLDDQMLRQIARSVSPRRDDAWTARQVVALRDLLKHSALRVLLSLNGRDRSQIRVYRELPITQLVALGASAAGGDGIRSGFIDRLEIDSASARVIDFKTDEVDAVGAAVAGEGYRAQMEAYRAAAADIAGVTPQRVELILAFTAAGVVVKL